MTVYRIALARYAQSAKEAFSGQSGYGTDGRWHSRGRYLDYAAASRSLATLERLVHYKRFDGLAPHVIFTVEIPDNELEVVVTVPRGWDGMDLLPAAQQIGNTWCDEARSAALQVPSAITPGENNYLINSRHPAWKWTWVSRPEKFEFDPRLAELIRHKRPS